MHVRFFFFLIHLSGSDFSRKTCVSASERSSWGQAFVLHIVAEAWKFSLFDFIASFLFVVWKKKWSRVLFTKLFKQLTFVTNIK